MNLIIPKKELINTETPLFNFIKIRTLENMVNDKFNALYY